MTDSRRGGAMHRLERVSPARNQQSSPSFGPKANGEARQSTSDVDLIKMGI
jgi:hypothetical protein